MHKQQSYILFFVIISCLPTSLFAQSSPSFSAHSVNSSISIDGRLDESAWQQAQTISGFRQFEPNEGDSSSEKTEVRVLYGNGNVYIGAILHDDNPSAIEKTLAKRDDYNRADWFLVSIDSYFNHKNAYVFGVNAAGVQFDAIQGGGGGGGGFGGGGGGGGRGGGGGGNSQVPRGMDPSWDAIWQSSVRVTDEGWIVEMSIPNSMLRFPNTENQTWGIQFMRRIPRLGEVSEWPLVPRSERSNLVAQFGHLTDINNIEPRPNLQIRPYTVAGLNSTESGTKPGTADVSNNFDVGGDLKVGLGPNVTLDATINPDFGQVESDPAQLNLTAFETFFQEKRPFFIEGIDIFRFDAGRGDLLYTRRIGAHQSIIGAGKLSGRTQNGLSFGALVATEGDNFNPTRNYGVARVRQQLGTFSEVGAILTAVDAPANSIGRLQSISGGADWDIRFLDNQYGIEGFSAFTNRSWTVEDQSTSTGFSGQIHLRKRQGALDGFTGIDVSSDKFNPNDIGQVRQNNFISIPINLGYQINNGRSFGPFQRAMLNLNGNQQFSYNQGLDLGTMLRFNSNWTLKNFQQVRLGVNTFRTFGGYDLYETRGLGPWNRPRRIELQGNIDSDNRRDWQLSPNGSVAFDEDGGLGYDLSVDGRWNIGTRISLSGTIGGEWEQGVTAWSSSETFKHDGQNWFIGSNSDSPDNLSSSQFVQLGSNAATQAASILNSVTPYSTNPDQYYVPVFGKRDSRSLNFTLRSNVTFTSKISLQIYSQLFLARGQYHNFQIMQNKDDLANFQDYPKRDEFIQNTLQSNFVLQWEYHPGSHIYLVWTHGQHLQDNIDAFSTSPYSPYSRSIGGNINDTFGVFPDNAVMLKVEYTFLY